MKSPEHEKGNKITRKGMFVKNTWYNSYGWYYRFYWHDWYYWYYYFNNDYLNVFLSLQKR